MSKFNEIFQRAKWDSGPMNKTKPELNRGIVLFDSGEFDTRIRKARIGLHSAVEIEDGEY